MFRLGCSDGVLLGLVCYESDDWHVTGHDETFLMVSVECVSEDSWHRVTSFSNSIYGDARAG